MLKRGRFPIAALLVCAVLLVLPAFASASSNNEARHKYAVARQRLADLQKSPDKKKYRSYWLDCLRSFELVERKYPGSPAAADACFDRAGLHQSLYRFYKNEKDLNESLRLNGACQAAYPRHVRAPEALYRIVALSLDQKKDPARAAEALARLSREYPSSAWTGKARALTNPAARGANTGPKTSPGAPQTAAQPGKAKTLSVVRSIRHWSGGAYTRIVIDRSRPGAFQAQALRNPDRLVFDMLNARVGASLNKEPVAVNDGILKQVRASQYAQDTVRVVLDLASIKSYAAFPLRDPERLVIDVTGYGDRAADSPPPGSESGMQQVPENPDGEEGATPPAQTNDSAVNDGPLSLSRQMGLKIKTIAIDAGHGGHDPGAIGRSGLKEKTVTLDIARRLSALVQERLGCKVIMTRDRDVFIPLDQRPFIAKAKGADLFVSIHVNANRKAKARGIETYIQGLQASDREAMATAARENAMSTKKLSELDSEIDKILRDLKQDNKLEESLQLAHTVQASLVDTAKPLEREVVNLGVKRAFFYVLINTQMPSILAEVGFISNPDEERQLRKASHRQAIAEALYQGVKKYVDTRSPQMMGI